MSIKLRKMIERQIAEKLVDTILKTGESISIKNDHDEESLWLKDSRDKDTIMRALFSSSEDILFFHIINHDGTRVKAWVWLIYGNDGIDVIHDHTVNAMDIVRPAEELSDKLEAEWYP